MKRFIGEHRAVLGFIGVAAFAGLFASFRASPGYTPLDLGLLVLALLGAVAIGGSPYWKILYRESPLRRPVMGRTDLDERELALRDRAAGLTYSLYAAFNLLVLFAAAELTARDVITLDDGVLYHFFVPYAWFALLLPVIVLEWFEPSGLATEEEEAG
jgi:hypothetical protein